MDHTDDVTIIVPNVNHTFINHMDNIPTIPIASPSPSNSRPNSRFNSPQVVRNCSPINMRNVRLQSPTTIRFNSPYVSKYVKSAAHVDQLPKPRSASVRKERRRDYSSCLGLPPNIDTKEEFESPHGMLKSGDTLQDTVSHEMHAPFCNIMKNENADKLNAFISCKEDTKMHSKTGHVNTKKSVCKYDSLSDMERADAYWKFKVDKVLQEMMLRTLRTSSELRNIIVSFEELLSNLLCIESMQTIEIPYILNQTCTKPIEFKIYEDSVKLFTAFKKEHALLRVLLHGLCQYHGLRSQSCGSQNARVTHVIVPLGISTQKMVEPVAHPVTKINTSEANDDEWVLINSSDIAGHDEAASKVIECNVVFGNSVCLLKNIPLLDHLNKSGQLIL